MPERRKTLFIDSALHHSFKLACTRLRITMQDQAEALIGAWVDDAERKQRPPPGRRKKARAAPAAPP